MTDDTNGESTQFMIFRVSEGLRRSDDDGLAGMNTQRVEILHITNGDTVVISVAHDLIFDLFPSLQGLLYQHLRREREGFLREDIQLLLVVAKARTQTA